MSGTRDENLFMARLSEQAERYEDMIEYMKRISGMGAELNIDERNLLSAAYKNSVGKRRMAARAVSSYEREVDSAEVLKVLGGYREKVEKELSDRCSEVLDLLASSLLPKSTDAEAKVFYMKMQGDYHRYLAEFTEGAKQEQCGQDALAAYKSASEVADAELQPTDPIRLGLALNFSVFYYEVLGAPSKACSLAQDAFEKAASVGEASDDSVQIMQLLRDNLSLWAAEAGDADKDGTAVEEL